MSERLAIEKLHREKIQFAILGRCRINIVDNTDVPVPDLERAFQFRRQEPSEPRLGNFNGNSEPALAVKGLINYAHAAFAHATQNLKPSRNGLTASKTFSRASRSMNSIRGRRRNPFIRSSQ